MPYLDQLRLQHGAGHLHQLGARSVAEFILQIAAATGASATILDILEEYRDLTPELLRATGGDRFPPRPIRVVSQ